MLVSNVLVDELGRLGSEVGEEMAGFEGVAGVSCCSKVNCEIFGGTDMVVQREKSMWP